MRLTVKSDYAIRALAELAARSDGTTPVRAAELSEAQDIPLRFLLGILAEARKGRAGRPASAAPTGGTRSAGHPGDNPGRCHSRR